MKNLFLVLLMVGLGVEGFAQAPDTLWTRTYGANGYREALSHVAIEDGGFLIVGAGSENNELQQIYVVRTNLNGDTVWTKSYGGQINEYACDVVQTSDGGFAFVGCNANFGLQSRMYLVRTDMHGNSLWCQTYGSGGNELPFDILLTSDGGFLLSGLSYTLELGHQAYVVRTDCDGDTLWTQEYGGVGDDEFRAAIETADSGLLIVGSTASFGMLLVRTDLNGDTLFTRTYGYLPSCYDICKTLDGGFVMVGTTMTPMEDLDIFAVKITDNGDTVWTRTYDEPGYNEGYSITSTDDGGFACAGFSHTDETGGLIYVIKANSDGDIIWTKLHEGTSDVVAHSIVQTSRGEYSIAGLTDVEGQNRMYLTLLASDSPHPVVQDPNGGDLLPVFATDTILWTDDIFESGVRIELNRHYPIGEWELVSNSTENDGEYEWAVSEPWSDSCRIRICALSNNICDLSDGNFAIVPSQGYLALVKCSQLNAAVRVWDTGAVECPFSGLQWFRMKNFGSESIVVFQPLEPASSEFSLASQCETSFVLAPNQMSACSVQVVFDPASDGEYSDVLRIQTDAVNGVNGFVEIGLSGEQISTPAAPEVVISTAGLDAQLNWAVVDTSVGGCAVSDLWYAVFYSPTSGGPFCYHGWTAGLSYTHLGVVNFSVAQFYQVVAVEGPVALALGFERGMEMGEVLKMMKSEG